jgi:PAS domain-containing protein
MNAKKGLEHRAQASAWNAFRVNRSAMEWKSAIASPVEKTAHGGAKHLLTRTNVADIDSWVWAELPQLFETPAAFDRSLVLVYLHDGAVRWASDALLRLLGYSRHDFDRGAIDWDETTPPEYWTLEDRYAGRLECDQKTTVYEYVKEVTARNGVRAPVRVRVARSVSDSQHVLMLLTELTEVEIRKER